MSHLAIVAWDGDKKIVKYQPCVDLAAAQAHVASVAGPYPNAFACEQPNDFTVRKYKVNASGDGLELDQTQIDADVALTQAIADEAARVQTFVDHADFQTILDQLKTATASQVITALTNDLTGATTLGQVKTVVGTYLAKIILVEAYLVRNEPAP